MTGDRTFLGHPRGLVYLAFTEMWERFSYYGMVALLVLYMVQELLLPGHVENVWGMAGLRGGLEGVFGPLSNQALASQLFGLYGGLVYLTPILGGWLADRFFGTRPMVVTGILLMTAGHFAMTFEETFLIALALLIFGSGALKGNIAAQVGQLYPRDDEARRSRGYTIFSLFINIGAFGGPLASGALAQAYGWHVGFAFVGVLMLIAIAVYMAGRSHLPDGRPAPRGHGKRAPLTAAERRTLILMLPVLVAATLGHIVYFQSVNVAFVWIAEHVDLATPLGTIPIPWFGSVDPMAGILFMPLLIAWWGALARRDREPGDLGKIGIGMMLMASGMTLFAAGAFLAGETGKASIAWPLLGYICTGIGFLWYWPVTLAFVSRRAPQAITALAIGFTYVTLFIAGLSAGFLGSFYEQVTPDAFFLGMAAIPAAGAALLFLIRHPLTRALDRNLAAPAPIPPAKSVTA
ncbi:peptide MFS transporter [Erythrobacter sp. JK5]|uniref:peptide MFS transporter n=1 Tax=Erythrobacter sp. JK5 TaxID=2829500 RepID=UPI001BA9F43E|nr:peptide MFS transporter [Erythrobacter sp. JK5]QUL37642.1 peptide MFS transporter [Erythrobacter sp. JK5]